MDTFNDDLDHKTDELINEIKNLNNNISDAASNLKKLENQELSPSTPDNIKKEHELNKLNLEQFIYNTAKTIIDSNLDSIKHIKPISDNCVDGKLIGAYAELIKATNTTLDSLSRIHNEKYKADNFKETKKLEIEAKNNNTPLIGNNNNILISTTREEILKLIQSASIPNKTIEVNTEEN